jgi:hypothetical protein
LVGDISSAATTVPTCELARRNATKLMQVIRRSQLRRMQRNPEAVQVSRRSRVNFTVILSAASSNRV